MNHLQNHLKRGDGILHCCSMRRCSARWRRRLCPARFFRSAAENQESPARVLMPRIVAPRINCRKIKIGDEQNQAPQTARNGNQFFGRNFNPKTAREKRDRAGQNEKMSARRRHEKLQGCPFSKSRAIRRGRLARPQQKRDDTEPFHPFARIFQPDPDARIVVIRPTTEAQSRCVCS
jgi:hypothetical protein